LAQALQVVQVVAVVEEITHLVARAIRLLHHLLKVIQEVMPIPKIPPDKTHLAVAAAHQQLALKVLQVVLESSAVLVVLVQHLLLLVLP
jgi:hypothetical protein